MDGSLKQHKRQTKLCTISEKYARFLDFWYKKMWFKNLGTGIVLNFMDRKIKEKIRYKDKQNYAIYNMLKRTTNHIF